MKHGRPLIAALEPLARAADRRQPPSERQPVGDAALRPIRPGAFAAWAARREPPAPAAATVLPPAVRLVGRPPAI